MASPRSVDFAMIGHPESWETALAMVRILRGEKRGPISLDDVRDIIPWIPPRPVCRIEVASSAGAFAKGIYIDSFLPPDRLDQSSFRGNLARVREAVICAIREGATVAALGGFSSILLEANSELLPESETVFTTGNTLTVAYIVKAVEVITQVSEKPLCDRTLLVIGATGDVGSGCARYLATRVKHLLLCARNAHRLGALRDALVRQGVRPRVTTAPQEFLAETDLVICAASLPRPSLSMETAPADAIICDAGYPKNVLASRGAQHPTVFFGGMGQVREGFRMEPDLSEALTPHPFPRVAQGCALEGVLLAFERRWEPFSRGRGLIVPERVDEIWALAQKHGLDLAPFFNSDGPCSELTAALPSPAAPRSSASIRPTGTSVRAALS